MRFGKFIILFGLLLIASLLFLLTPPGSKNSKTILISPLAESSKKLQSIINKFTESRLKSVVEKSLSGTHGTYGIVIKNLKSGESYSQNEHLKFDTASLYKLWVLGTTYRKLASEELKRDQVLNQEVKELNKMFLIETETAELTEGTVTMNVETAIEKMITISDNYSALLLASAIRNSNISKFIEEEGLSESNLGEPPKTTPYDTALFFEKLYNGTVVDKESSDEMLGLLKRQELNDRIPKYLPDDVDVAHKTGEMDGFKHDAGIVYGKDPYLFVVLSKSDSPLGAAERIANLSKDVFEYFEKK